ncbi:MAG: NAD(P)-dependent oxidoreductase [Opitutaceae bacterium]|nr:NAD(P)-dependent oxidoreductase [Opitutaceae bacterium]
MPTSKTTAPRRGLPCPPDKVDEFLSEPSAAVIDVLARTAGRILVLGAGGKMGLHLTLMIRRGLKAAGRDVDSVLAVSRFSTLRDQDEFGQHGIKTHACDLSDRAAVTALPDAPTIFFLAGVKFGTASAPDLLHKFNVEMPGIVADRFRRSRIVAFSTGCVYPFVRPDTGGATEAMTPEPPGEYAASCLAREHAFAAVSREHGTAVALIRLNYSVEFRYGVLVDIAGKVFRGEPVDVSMGYVNVIWQRDAVDYTIRALELAGSPPVPVNLTGPHVLSVRTLAHRFGELLERPVKIVGQEAETAWLNNASRIHQRFGVPPTALDDVLIWTAEWVRAGGESWGKPTGFEKRSGKF